MTRRLATGHIVWAEVADANGIRKLRPAVIVTPTKDLPAAGPIDIVAVTSRLTEPLPDDHVLLPWHPRGHPRTGLNRRCAAVCTWVAQVAESDIQDVAGIVPSAVMSVILSKVAAALPPAPPPGETGAAPPAPDSASPPTTPRSASGDESAAGE
jgi:mRNA-degrading endonuclease toxin of MazEF toxin-antitoxin module